MKAYLGIDGGGTSTRSVLVSETGKVLGRAVVGPSNVQQVSVEKLFENLQLLVDLTFVDIPDSIDYVCSCFGLAGAASAENKQEIREMLATLTPVPSETPILTCDAHIALVGALANRPGLILIAGTGSICLACDAEGGTYRTGGWGPVHDDLGSGSWIGRQAMKAVFQEYDGRLESGPWQHTVLSSLQCASIEDLLVKVKNDEIANPQISALAPTVIQLAQTGNESAEAILQEAAEELARVVVVTHQKSMLGVTPLVLMGGLLERSDSFRGRVARALELANPEIVIKKRLMAPIVGAVVVACNKSQDGLPAELEQALRAEQTN